MKAGRQRTFDKEVALEQAMEVFWSNGYPGTSLADLTKAMGINKPSMYSAFGNKEQLFVHALTLYLEKHGAVHAKQLVIDGVSLQQRISGYLSSIAEMVTDTSLPSGCFICLSISEIAGNCLPQGALEAVEDISRQSELGLVQFFAQERVEGNLSNDASQQALADYILTQQYGLAVAGRNGSSKQQLDDVIALAVSPFNT